jgi:cytochrome c-type biogenesis protein CcmH/NrfF
MLVSMRPRAKVLGAVNRLLLLGVLSGTSLLFLKPGVRPAAAQTGSPSAALPQAMTDPRALELTRTTMSPFCPGRTLDDCPSPYAGEWRSDIRKWVAEGVSTEDIRKRLRARSADRDLSGTPSTALDAVLPIAVTLGSLLLLGILLRLLLRPVQRPSNLAPLPARKPTETQKLTEGELDARLDDELKDLDD